MKIDLNLSGVVEEKTSATDFVPAGKYEVEIVEVEMKENESTKNWRMDIFMRIISGDQAGKIVRDMLNPYHSNAEAQRISLSRIKGILFKIGHNNPEALADTDEMIGGKLIVDVIEDSFTNNEGEIIETNKIKKVHAADNAAPVATPAAPKSPAKKAPAKKAPAASPNKPAASTPAKAAPAPGKIAPWMK